MILLKIYELCSNILKICLKALIYTIMKFRGDIVSYDNI